MYISPTYTLPSVIFHWISEELAISRLLFLSCSVTTEALGTQSRQANNLVSNRTFLWRVRHAASVPSDFLYVDGGFSSYVSTGGLWRRTPLTPLPLNFKRIGISRVWSKYRRKSHQTLHTLALITASMPKANLYFTPGVEASTLERHDAWALHLDRNGRGMGDPKTSQCCGSTPPS